MVHRNQYRHIVCLAVVVVVVVIAIAVEDLQLMVHGMMLRTQPTIIQLTVAMLLWARNKSIIHILTLQLT